MFYVYVIYSEKAGRKYTGYTTDIDKRLEEHNHDLLSKYTKKKGPWVLIYKEELETIGEALAREKILKSGVGRDFLKKITGK